MRGENTKTRMKKAGKQWFAAWLNQDAAAMDIFRRGGALSEDS